ncbi:MAG: four helix bundle protein [Chloroflexota bacterium]|nr:four helix bundle protein [Chloroflexota bacterium]
MRNLDSSVRKDPPGWDRDVPYDIRERTFQFAIRVIQAVRQLPRDTVAQVVLRQLVKSATSIGANMEEADGSESTRDFIHKTSVSRKEACESRYWLRIVRATVMDTDDFVALERESDELVRILSAMIANAKRPPRNRR